jgi:hypothetical protein
MRENFLSLLDRQRVRTSSRIFLKFGQKKSTSEFFLSRLTMRFTNASLYLEWMTTGAT